MLHRLSLRVLPQLNALVTDLPVRKRKRWVMLVPGLVAFGIYRLLKDVLPLSEPFVLFGLSGCISALAAIWAYRQGRGISIPESIRQDGVRRWVWLVGWVGVAYGIQLSLLVLAILQIFVGYDFLLHPEGPAMMAIIISCTSVTRDAFEIGYVQRMIQEGTVVPTFPDGGALRTWIPQEWMAMAKWSGLGMLAGFSASWGLTHVGSLDLQPLLQTLLVPVVVASVSLLAFFAGEALLTERDNSPRPHTWVSILWFWIWPNLTFSATYFLVLMGTASYVFRVSEVSELGFGVIAAATAMVMTSYSIFLGWRKSYEERVVTIPKNIQRCPFVMGLLEKAKGPEARPSFEEGHVGHGDLVK